MASTNSRQLPRDARLVALMIASMGVDDSEPGVIAMLMEYAHRWTADILADANVYAEHAHRNPPSTAPQMDDVKLAIQARLEQTMSTPWPREYLLSLASSLNKYPLPPIPESYGIRLPPERERVTAINFNMVPHSVQTAAEDNLDDNDDDEEMEEVQDGADAGGVTGEGDDDGAEDDEDDDEDDEDDDLFDDEDPDSAPASGTLPPTALDNNNNIGNGTQAPTAPNATSFSQDSSQNYSNRPYTADEDYD